MICPPCRKAGELNTIGKDGEAGSFLSVALEVAAEEHAKCEGCACQHVTGKVLRTEGLH